jgi:hypothetical protein
MGSYPGLEIPVPYLHLLRRRQLTAANRVIAGGFHIENYEHPRMVMALGVGSMSRKAATPVSKLTHALHGGRTADNNKYLGVAKRFHNVVTPLVARLDTAGVAAHEHSHLIGKRVLDPLLQGDCERAASSLMWEMKTETLSLILCPL